MIVIKTYFGAVVVKRCDVSTCYDRSWSRYLGQVKLKDMRDQDLS